MKKATRIIRIQFTIKEFEKIRSVCDNEHHLNQVAIGTTIKNILVKELIAFETNNEFGTYVPFQEQKKDKTTLTFLSLYVTEDLYNKIKFFADSMDVSMIWFIRFLVLPVIDESFKNHPDEKKEKEN